MVNMVSGNTLASVAALIGDAARANMLSALMGGQALTARELADCAGVLPQTASGHLSRLVDGGLVTVEKQGRHRYFRLTSSDVAEMLEVLSALSASGPARYRPPGPKDASMRQARTCYDHMAGSIAVALADHFLANDLIVFDGGAGLVTTNGADALRAFGIDVADSRSSRRALCRTCLDWSERRHHIGGWLGAALLERCKALNWLSQPGRGRTLVLTRKGQGGFAGTFGLSPAVLKIIV